MFVAEHSLRTPRQWTHYRSGMHPSEAELAGYLADAYALERVGLSLLLKASEHGGPEAARLYRDHGDRTREHLQLVGERLERYGRVLPGEQSHVEVGALRVDFQLEAPQTAAEFAISIYTLESLQIALYHLVYALARRCRDEPTQLLAGRILEQEEEAAELIANTMADELAA